MNNTHQRAPDGRMIHHWKGLDRQRDIGELADAIVAAVPGLFDYSGGIAQLDEAGGLSPVNFQTFRDLLDRHLAGIQCVRNGTGWQRDLFAYRFDPAVRYDPTKGGPAPKPDNRLPDSKVLEEIYRDLLVLRLPKAIA
jgi:hypothetical protein